MNSAMEFLIEHGYVVIFIGVFLEQIGLPAPSSPLLLAAGALVGLGRLSLLPVLALAVTASLICDSLWFRLGKRRGSSILEFVCRISLEPDICISKTHSAYSRYGAKSLMFAKFLPALGTLGPPMAGMYGLAPWKFALLDTAGALAWSGGYVIAGWAFRTQLEDLAALLSRFGVWSGIAVLLALAGYVGSKYIRRRRIYRTLRTARITPLELKRRMDAGDKLLIVDLRAEFERREGHIPGAVGLTYNELDSLPSPIAVEDVVLYCSCPDEITSVRAALRLKRRGAIRVHPLLGGFAGWRELGFPVENPAPGAAILESGG